MLRSLKWGDKHSKSTALRSERYWKTITKPETTEREIRRKDTHHESRNKQHDNKQTRFSNYSGTGISTPGCTWYRLWHFLYGFVWSLLGIRKRFLYEQPISIH